MLATGPRPLFAVPRLLRTRVHPTSRHPRSLLGVAPTARSKSTSRYISTSIPRPYQHSSTHAPASKQRSDLASSEPSGVSSETQHNGIAYSRHELISSWHAASRQVSPLDVSFEKRETLDVSCELLSLVSVPLFSVDGSVDALSESQTRSCDEMARLSARRNNSRRIESWQSSDSW